MWVDKEQKNENFGIFKHKLKEIRRRNEVIYKRLCEQRQEFFEKIHKENQVVCVTKEKIERLKAEVQGLEKIFLDWITSKLEKNRKSVYDELEKIQDYVEHGNKLENLLEPVDEKSVIFGISQLVDYENQFFHLTATKKMDI